MSEHDDTTLGDDLREMARDMDERAVHSVGSWALSLAARADALTAALREAQDAAGGMAVAYENARTAQVEAEGALREARHFAEMWESNYESADEQIGIQKARAERAEAERDRLDGIAREWFENRKTWVEAHDRLAAQVEAGEASDGHHTHSELYRYRMLYNAHAAHGWLSAGIPVVKSWRHSDGEECFGGGWFIVTAKLPTGQVSNHYTAEYWGLFRVPEVALAPEWDGHTPALAADRLQMMLALDAGKEE